MEAPWQDFRYELLNCLSDVSLALHGLKLLGHGFQGVSVSCICLAMCEWNIGDHYLSLPKCVHYVGLPMGTNLFVTKQGMSRCLGHVFICVYHMEDGLHIYIFASVNWVIIGIGNSLVPGGHQAISWTNGDLSSISPLGIHLNEIWIKKYEGFDLKIMHVKLSAKSWLFCSGLFKKN